MRSYYTPILTCLLFFLLAATKGFATNAFDHAEFVQDSVQVKEFKGTVIAADTEKELVFATIAVENTNISTITNAEGSFSLKVPLAMAEGYVTISFLGYETQRISLNKFTRNGNIIRLTPAAIPLQEVSVSSPKNALSLVESMLKKRGDNYIDTPVKMTAFYRETIKKRRRDASLSEAVVNIYKQPNSSTRGDIVTLFKSRKSTNYNRLDTIAVKLQGGPFTPLYLDIMKYPSNIFTDYMMESYDFTFDRPTQVNDRSVYVVNFKQKPEELEPLYYGKLYIETETHALVSAVFNLNVENRELASELLVRKKPAGTSVYPTDAAYRVDYRIKDGKWYYGYSNVQLAVVVNKKRKLFNSKYYLNSEMAITDWEPYDNSERIRSKNRLRSSIIISDKASGFSDPDFWGPYNVIEPEKSIESAIEKIQRQLEKENDA
ncbi:carboxypeptidase-like regulatory domain-containing protein [Robertkochia marina]|uniref:Carboxypeptidase-like regulatory domain-containing protein n=1 Tax=Robertkochia marina TaxID=1227945 RepID=A0A4V3UY60_9FLAO|nr:carboxypeptidase-like regulatory domain-containing protein [Robertkochia marina]THD67886.1 carboxypeptidase-like regulatory domain-containing protein [Robertkochia marina]TRZ42075.1 carboxypeptidase-like regulatory domain-containing protein [Robertkochia marina]